jgi:hypothetical protein
MFKLTIVAVTLLALFGKRVSGEAVISEPGA